VHFVQPLRLCTGRTAHRGSRGIALHFRDNGTRRGWGVSVTSRLLFTPGKDPVPIVQESVWASGRVWTSAENLTPPPGFDPRTVHPVASRYTDYATRPTDFRITILKCIYKGWIGEGHKLNWSGSFWGQMAGVCERGNEPFGSIKCWEFPDHLRIC
jgi:hypothetical protein